MPEQTFKSPNFYEREIEIGSTVSSSPTGVPAGIIGTAPRGPAFVPVTVGSFGDFVNKFGGLDHKSPGSYGVNEFLKNRNAVTFLRVLGGGSNSVDADFARTVADGRVKGAGFRLYGDDNSGSVYFLRANHTLAAGAKRDGSFEWDDTTPKQLIRAMIMTVEGNVLGQDGSNQFKLTFTKTFTPPASKPSTWIDSATISFNPDDAAYLSKVLNTDPEKFAEVGHLLYADFPVDNEVASVATADGSLSVVQGDSGTDVGALKMLDVNGDDDTGDLTFKEAFGSFDTRYRSASSPWFISQPYGEIEYDLFKCEALDAGAAGNSQFKLTISDLRASTDTANPYPTFTLQVRRWSDTDQEPQILEAFSGCTLNPRSPQFISRLVGDMRESFDHDALDETERRVIVTGKYPNRSVYVRVIAHPDLEAGTIPASAMPFGFRGHELLAGDKFGEDNDATLPPVPFRFKITKSPTDATALDWPGDSAELNESVLNTLCWGVKFERDNKEMNPNMTVDKNGLLESLTKFLGNSKLQVLATGDAADAQNNNKFTLARVALGVAFSDSEELKTLTPAQYMKSAAYLRSGDYKNTNLTISEKIAAGGPEVSRMTLASILSLLDPTNFNRFSQFAKFSTFLGGGWDGLNILSKHERMMGDRATSIEAGGCAHTGYTTPGFGYSVPGKELSNAAVSAYRTAVNIMTEPTTSGINLLALPGVREALITDYAATATREYGLGLYLMDVPAYDDARVRLYDDETKKPNIPNTIEEFQTRRVDNSYTCAYFPDVVLDDTTNRRRVRVPASIAALGALGFNDRVTYPWFAPAGFNRAALDFVTNVPVRLNVSDRDALYEARINPIATFPRLGFVIYGQKTLQMKKSSLDRVNVRRLLLEVKRIIKNIAQGMVFEQNTPEIRNRFVADSSIQLAMIQAASGVEAFQVVMNETNNSRADVDANRVNGRIVVVPTRVIEYIAIDFIITNSGVQFV
jgi:hypothetical protein